MEDTASRTGAAAARPATRVGTAGQPVAERAGQAEVVFEVTEASVHYGAAPAIKDVTMPIHRHEITAFIGPSGCGKSTLLRCFNRTNDLIPTARISGRFTYHGADLYARDVDPVVVRRRIGMVFQKPNPFPKSIYDNLAFGPRVNGMDVDLDEVVETSLKRAALWEEVRNKLKTRDGAMGLSGGQQQRLCIARALAVSPDVILMDEPCSALDPVATARIEDLMRELQRDYTLMIVTHNMQQAARVSDRTAFITTEVDHEHGGQRFGRLVEYDRTERIFQNPEDSRTEDYVSGRFG
ncbi:MAG: phosphate ABC transporter ATP-binding protein PstB [Actinomycetota bacterium]|nr:phosphate ABC transporter ATP-binding protein PstB [Actinomycetota bacterium]